MFRVADWTFAACVLLCAAHQLPAQEVFTDKVPFKKGETMEIRGYVYPGAGRFAINVGSSSSDLALHFNPRFYYYTTGGQNSIVMNSARGGSWGSEQQESHFPFKRGEKFTMSITHNGNSFGIKLPDDRVISFPNRLGRDSYDHVSFDGEIRIFSIKAEVGGAGQASF
ncbi:beta-galactoside-binding lectin-like isoform X1 [Lepisosteus oculatus]|uniref:beta-galactoside-binding lectin-like isoform X1 n=1 Tax=Lepisosteus oculatus TaxID=7918 RepID=UPI0035F503D9